MSIYEYFLSKMIGLGMSDCISMWGSKWRRLSPSEGLKDEARLRTTRSEVSGFYGAPKLVQLILHGYVYRSILMFICQPFLSDLYPDLVQRPLLLFYQKLTHSNESVVRMSPTSCPCSYLETLRGYKPLRPFFLRRLFPLFHDDTNVCPLILPRPTFPLSRVINCPVQDSALWSTEVSDPMTNNLNLGVRFVPWRDVELMRETVYVFCYRVVY